MDSGILEKCINVQKSLVDLKERLGRLGHHREVCCDARVLIWSYLSATSFWLQWRRKTPEPYYREILYSVAIMHCWPLLYQCQCTNSPPMHVVPRITPVGFSLDLECWDSNLLAVLARTLSEGSLSDRRTLINQPFYGTHDVFPLELIKSRVMSKLVNSVTFYELYELYPTYDIYRKFAVAIERLMQTSSPSFEFLVQLLDRAREILDLEDHVPSAIDHNGLSLVVSLNYAMKLFAYITSVPLMWEPFNRACLKFLA